MRITTLILSTALAFAVSTAQAAGPNRAPITTTTLDAGEIETARFMREEEKLARDVYRAMFLVWGQRIFSNIAQSEQTHMDAMARLLAQYGIPDPVTSDAVGDFQDPGLADWFVTLTDTGTRSLEDALRVGALIEETDIRDIQEAIDATDETAMQAGYQHLLRGSRNHLRAYVGQLERLGVVYEPQVLSLAELSEIVDAPTERGTPGARRLR